MAKSKNRKQTNPAFELAASTFLPGKERLHIYGRKVICVTDSKGYSTPNNSDPLKIVVDASNGFIPLWSEGTTLNWRFSPAFGDYFRNPDAAKSEIRKLIGEAILKWEDACPVKFSENDDAWDFEVIMTADNCNAYGCVLASAFFPQQGRDKLVIYPKMLTYPRSEQVETLVHEFGHVFGLRHFFAQIKEKAWRSEIFGKHAPFSIMNYGEESVLTDYDIKDLKHLYELVWSGELKEINKTRIVTFKPYHMSM